MTNIYTETNRAIRQAHSRFTHEFTLYTYQWDDTGGNNEYADGDWVESSQSVQASIRESGTQNSVESGASGQDIDYDAVIWMDASAVPTEFSLGQDDETRASEFTDVDTGQRWEAIGSYDEKSLLKIYVTEVE